MIDLSVHIKRMKAHIEADELVPGTGFAAAFAQATKRGGPAKSAPLDAVPCTAYLNWLPGPYPHQPCARTQWKCMHCGSVLQVLVSNLRCYRARAFAIT